MAKQEDGKLRLFAVRTSPHVSGALTTPRVMYDVLIALVPAILAAVWLFRGHAVVLLVSTVAGAVLAEMFGNRLLRREQSIGDGSAILTGVILALCLPPTFPFYFAALGGAVSTGIGKMAFGGLGYNVFNPAMVGRTFLTACFGTMMTTWIEPGTLATIGGVEAVTAATPLGLAKQLLKAGGDASLMAQISSQMPALPRLFLGNIGGSLGETSALAILLGGAWMLWRRTITWHIPIGVLLGAAVFGTIAWLADPAGVVNPLTHLLGGSMIFGAFIIATDPVTCPLSAKGRFWFGVGVGLLTMLIRIVGGYPEGVMYAVLLMNAITPFLDRWTATRPVGLGGPSYA
ncbi:MAG: RnfABCDGE type electron transport complex subunit D [Candidatus Eisenbacteria bacterium]|nr:RnfABCDGE type electron transport complex subunit D [Candidatus Eisenbacteria bacterium]